MNQNLINLDECVLNALDLYINYGTPRLEMGKHKRIIGIGSGNAAVTAKILLEDQDAVLADESTYQKKLDTIPGIDAALLISASAGKHAPIIAKDLEQRRVETYFLTCNKDGEASKLFDNQHLFVFPSKPEPLTYNTSTYMGMILSKTKEDPKKILEHIKNVVDPLIPDMRKYDAFFLLTRPEFDNIREAFLTKFDELFQPIISGRCFTTEQTIHAKTLVQSEKELYLAFGCDHKSIIHIGGGVNIPLPENAGYAAMMAVAYYTIGKIQAQNKPFYKERVGAYAEEQKKMFAHK
jgi:hypothetical protein